jgi:hypothetical protein
MFQTKPAVCGIAAAEVSEVAEETEDSEVKEAIMPACNICGSDQLPRDEIVCVDCFRRVPPILLVAAERKTPGHYAIGLCNGAVVRFEHAWFEGDFVSLWNGSLDDAGPPDVAGLPIRPVGDLAIRVSEIAWACEIEATRPAGGQHDAAT